MVPGSTLRYGSSFWRETVRWRAFKMLPIEAAVMPFPSEETTPPVTKTYFDIQTSRWFYPCYRVALTKGIEEPASPGRTGSARPRLCPIQLQPSVSTAPGGRGFRGGGDRKSTRL